MSARRLVTTGAENTARALAAAGTSVVFCLPGEETIALLEAIDAEGIELVVARHEQHAAFMAATHGRLTGRPGVLVTTLGPGMANAATGLAHATLGGFPMVHLAGQKPLRDNDEGSFQVIDQVAVATPLTKHATRVTDPADAEAAIHHAVRTAVVGRPGAVFVELPQDIATADGGSSDPWTPPDVPSPRVSEHTIGEIADRLAAARFPVALLGGGCQDAGISRELDHLGRQTGLAMCGLQMGIGVTDPDAAAWLPPLAMHRPDAAHLALERADLVLTIGYHPDEHPPLAWAQPDHSIIHLARWSAPIRRGYRPAIEAVGDVADAVRRLGRSSVRVDRNEIGRVREAIVAQLADESLDTDGDGVSPIEVIRVVRESLPETGRVVLDNGSYKLWFARHFRTSVVNGLLLDNGLATMGAGLAAATESARLAGVAPTLAVVGDGGFLMNVGDLETSVRLGVDLTVLVLRDDTYGFIADHQRERGRSRVAVDVTNPDVPMLARAFGATAAGATTGDELRNALDESFGRTGVTVIDCRLDEHADEALHAVDSLAGARRRLS